MYYDDSGKLKKVNKNKAKKSQSTIRFKVLRNGEKFPCCDYYGNRKNKAYAEVYPFMMKRKHKKGWSYLCRKHYFQEQKKFNQKLPACLEVEW